MSSGIYAANLPTFSGYGVSYGVTAPTNSISYYGTPVASAVPVANIQAAPVQIDQQTAAEIETRLTYLGQRRAPVLRRQVIRVPGPAGRIQQVVRRLQTPPPDIIEKVIVTKPQRDVINLLIERPSTPPPTIQEKRIQTRPHKPAITQQVVRVAPRTVPVQAPIAVAQTPLVYAPEPAYYSAAAPVYSYSTSNDALSGYGGYANYATGYGLPANSGVYAPSVGYQTGGYPAYVGGYPAGYYSY